MDDNKAKIQSHMSSLASSQQRTSPPETAATRPNALPPGRVSFELETAHLGRSKSMRPAHGDSFKVRFLGSTSVHSDKGNGHINASIRQVMAARAEQSMFKLSEFTLVVNAESLSLFGAPRTEYSAATNQPVSSLSDEEAQLATQFDVADLAFWSTHRENERLFGLIVREKQFKFACLVFESDVSAVRVCESITQATQLAFQLLVVSESGLSFKQAKYWIFKDWMTSQSSVARVMITRSLRSRTFLEFSIFMT